MAVLLSVLVVTCAIPAWLPIISKRQLSPGLCKAIIALTFSSLLQIIFVVCVGMRLLTFDHSLKFAAVGIPCCLLAFVLAFRETRRTSGIILGAGLGLAMWLLFITLH
jgi:hypothetical protein